MKKHKFKGAHVTFINMFGSHGHMPIFNLIVDFFRKLSKLLELILIQQWKSMAKW